MSHTLNDPTPPAIPETGKQWRVLVPAQSTAWSHRSVPALDNHDWVEAWDDIVPGYKQRRFDGEPQAAAACRLLRGCGHTTLSEPCDD